MRLFPIAIVLALAGTAAAQPELLDTLTRTARSVARDGRCASLPAIGNRVREIDADYYAKVFVRDPVIASCLAIDPRVFLTGAPPSVTHLQPVPPAPRERSYRNTLMTADLLGTLVTFGIGFPFISPIVHIAEGNPTAALESFGMRVAFPVAGAFAGAGLVLATESSQGESRTLNAIGGAALGFLIGAVTAVAIDYSYLAERPAAVPLVTPTEGGATFSLAGRF